MFYFCFLVIFPSSIHFYSIYYRGYSVQFVKKKYAIIGVRHFVIQHCENSLIIPYMRDIVLFTAFIIIVFHQFLKQFSQFAGHISMLLGVKIWRFVKVETFLVVGGWNDKECYPLRK